MVLTLVSLALALPTPGPLSPSVLSAARDDFQDEALLAARKYPKLGPAAGPKHNRPHFASVLLDVSDDQSLMAAGDVAVSAAKEGGFTPRSFR